MIDEEVVYPLCMRVCYKAQDFFWTASHGLCFLMDFDYIGQWAKMEEEKNVDRQMDTPNPEGARRKA